MQPCSVQVVLSSLTPVVSAALPLPFLQAEAAVQANWCAHLHAKYFSSVRGTLSPLGLSSSLAHSLWAISLVRSRTFSGELLLLLHAVHLL